MTYVGPPCHPRHDNCCLKGKLCTMQICTRATREVLKSYTFREPIETILPDGVSEKTNQVHLLFSSLGWVCLTRHILQPNCRSRCESQLRIKTSTFFFFIKKYRNSLKRWRQSKVKVKSTVSQLLKADNAAN